MKNLINKAKMVGYGIVGTVVTSPVMAEPTLETDLTAVKTAFFSKANVDLGAKFMVGVGTVLLLWGGYKWVTSDKGFEEAKGTILSGAGIAMFGMGLTALVTAISGVTPA